MEFDLNLLRLLVEMDKTRSVTKAAQTLEMSQSGVSTALTRLRLHFDDPLFVRTGKGMEPTPRAIQIIDTARSVLSQVQSVIDDAPRFDPTQARTVFRLAMPDIAETVFLPRLMNHLRNAAPHLQLHTNVWSPDELRPAMESGEVDLALGYFPDLDATGFFQQRLFHQTYACILSRDHSAKETLTELAYQTLPHAVVASPSRTDELFDRFLERRRLERNVALRTPHHLSLAYIIESTELIATVPLATADRYERAGRIATVPLPFTPPSFMVRQYWHRRRHRDPGVRWLQAQIAHLFRDSDDEWQTLERKLYGQPSREADESASF